MKPITGKDFAKVLERHGWQLLRIHGSHHIYGIPEKTERISVPVHRNTPLKIGLLKHLLKVADLSEKDL
jgi:predicted RNA binding protein YcfA (HicA-like mRNA interferase family)